MEYKYPEAFCLMIYECEKCGRRDSIWNARDGITPFTIFCSECDGIMKHILWDLDKVLPDYLPQRDQRVFVDSTPQISEVLIRARVRLGWDRDEYPMKEAFSSKIEAIKELLDFREGQPYLMTI